MIERERPEVERERVEREEKVNKERRRKRGMNEEEEIFNPIECNFDVRKRTHTHPQRLSL